MADFCTQCSDYMFGSNIKPDIDVEEIAQTVSNGHYLPVLCEGCGMRAVGKNTGGEIIVAIPEDVRDFKNDKVEWIKYEDFVKEHGTKYWYHAIPNSQD